jgi:hypothetical protein
MTERFLLSEDEPTPRKKRRRKAQPTAPVPGRPLLGEFIRHVPRRELVMRRVLDLQEDRFGADHTLGGRQISKADPDHHGFPVMPMTFTLEMMAEAAAVLVPGRVVTALRHIQLFRWLPFDEEQPVTVVVKARVVSAAGARVSRVDVEVEEASAAKHLGRSPAVVARATVVLRQDYPTPPPPASFRLAGERPCDVSLEQLYTYLFHGPLFHGVRSLDRTGDDGITSRVEVLLRDRLFRSFPEPDMLLDPVLLDVAMHPLASWHLVQPDQTGRILLPIGAKSVEFFGPPAPPGTGFTVQGRVTESAVRFFAHEVTVIGSDGKVYTRMSAVKYWRFYVPFGRVNFHGPKDQYFLSRRWNEAEAQLRPQLGPGADLVLMRLELPPDLQQAHLQRVVAQVTLAPDERNEFRGLRREPGRSVRWLMDRIAVKDAVRTYWRDRQGERLFPADIETHEPEPQRHQCRRRGAAGEELPSAVVVFAKGVTVAVAAAQAIAAVAVAHIGDPDGEPPTPDEVRLAEPWGAGRDEAIYRFRCARRAVAAARGLAENQLAQLRVQAADRMTGTVEVALGEENTERIATARDGNLIIALVEKGRND